MATNKKVGNDFESDFCNWLGSVGCWSHNFANRANGQPADIIAVRGYKAFLIDCKVCENDRFNCSRIEGNQHDSMERWQETVDGTTCVFVLKMGSDNAIYVIPYYKICDNISTLNRKQIEYFGITLEEFKEWILS